MFSSIKKHVSMLVIAVVILFPSSPIFAQEGAVLASGTGDDFRGWNWNGETASYLVMKQLVEGSFETTLIIREFAGDQPGLTIYERTFSSKDNIRGWSWDGTMASYIAFDASAQKTYLYIRPFDGNAFGNYARLEMSSRDNFRSWSWDGKTASYMAYDAIAQKTFLYIRPFDGKTFGKVTSKLEFSIKDNMRGWYWDGQRANYVAFNKDNGKTMMYIRSFDGKTYGPVEN